RGKETEYAPLDAQGWDECEPVYLEFPGWSENTHGVTEWDDLPPAARAYLRAPEELAGCPLSTVSTGPDREPTMVLQHPFAYARVVFRPGLGQAQHDARMHMKWRFNPAGGSFARRYLLLAAGMLPSAAGPASAQEPPSQDPPEVSYPAIVGQ